ncbi:MAG: TetR family transcriptional regulator [Sphingobium sp.]
MRTPRKQVREAVLEAAEALFRARGFQAASLEDIARAAKLTKGAVYSNFAGKDELFLAVLETHVGHTIARYRGAADDGEGGGDADEAGTLDRMAAFLAKSAIEDAAWSAAFAEFALHASRRPATAAALAAVRGRLRQEVIALLRPIVDHGQADEARLERAATLFFAIGNGLTLEALSDATRVDASVYREALERLLES